MNVVILKWNFFFEDTICFSRDFYWVFFFLLIQKVVSHSFDLKKKMFHSIVLIEKKNVSLHVQAHHSFYS